MCTFGRFEMENVEFRKHLKEKHEHDNIESQIQKKTQNDHAIGMIGDERGTNDLSVM